MKPLSPLNKHYFLSFQLLFGIVFVLDFLLLFVFNEFASFSRIPKGASIVTKGFTCSLECERAKFVF